MRALRQSAAAALVAAGVVTGALTAGSGTALASIPAAALPAGVPAGVPVSAPAGLPAGLQRAATPAYPPFTAPYKTLRLGAKGTAVKALQARLKQLGYVPGSVDGQYGGGTVTAVWAFQKAQGLRPASTVTRATWQALEHPKAPKVLVPGGRPDRVEVNLTKQLMVLYRNGVPRLISHISSGSGIPYTEYAVWNGKRQRFSGGARTPTGDFKTTWRVSGWHRSYLGELYNPIFFNGGIALHGALSVPLYPASHGCVRLPMNVARILPGLLGKGVPVHVRGHFVR
ncbi:murein L,D-transpeptidase [Microbispora sp. RL4-1S]|uniref:Murein L,D-transpeptidase n=1 Tax=Microbispora oryzae TaxID=2806554 RepID=A0A941AG11_9ACTN|nr:L,D-transpeptidase family protein [Microbispora oryzae]MBP2702415.1 murein L,D-transpeptidase [Microbispora oryzae]